ncbi:MAG: hypothetical protein MJK18_14790 [Bdellovibrionales bacterium]|nr:hypothetical protein [Bdellovibrionales bacterium]
MRFSSLQLKTHFLLVLVTAAMTASCIRGPSKPESQVEGSETAASFKAEEMTGESISQENDSVWKIATQKTYEYRVCLIARSTNARLPGGQSFYVEKPDRTRRLVKTNNRGCLAFTEKLDYDFTSDSVYVEVKRKIIGKAPHSGTQELRFAVNPWLKDRGEAGREFIDLNFGDQDNPVIANRMVPEILGTRMGQFSRTSNQALLIEESPGLTISRKQFIGNGQRVEIIIDAHPFVQTLNLNSERHVTPLMSGEYDVYVQLLATNRPDGTAVSLTNPISQAPEIISPELPLKTIRVENNGLLRYQHTFDLKYETTDGRIELAIKIVPKSNNLFDLEPFEGLYSVSDDFSQIYRLGGGVTQTRGIYSERSFNYSSFLENDTSNYADLANAKWVQDLPPVNYDHLIPRFVRVQGQGETATERTIIYRVSTRVTNSVTRAPIVNHDFQIKREDGEVLTIKSNHNGLLHWTNTIHHHYYQPEQFYMKSVEITHENSGRTDRYTLALNPWDSGWTFGMDERDRENSFSDAELDDSDKLANPRLMVDAFRYQTIRFRYVIDEFLTLNVKKAVVLALDALVQKQTINRGRQFEPLRDGIYLAKIALVKYYIDPFQQGLRLIRGQDGEHNLHYVYEGEIDPVDEDINDITDRQELRDATKGEYTSVIKKLIRVQAGRITTPLEFSMRDLRMMSIRSNIMVQLETIDENLLLQDNIINAKLDEYERQYNLYNCVGGVSQGECLDESERQALRERMLSEREEGLDRYREIIGGYLEDLHRQREGQGQLTETLDGIIQEMENNLASDTEIEAAYAGNGDSNRVYGGQRTIYDIPQGDWESLLEEARAQMPSLARNMQNYWNDWDDGWMSRSQNLVPNNEQMAIIERNQYRSMDLSGASSEQAELIVGERRELEKKSYEAYLSNMQSFLQGLHPDFVMSPRDIDDLLANDYRENPAVPLVDLNLYRNGDVSGLKSRTFIGPCTLVANDNMSELRPTDTIDEGECWSIDCHDRSDDAEETREVVDNSEFENSAYHDSLIPFTNSSVDDFVDDHYRNEQNYRRKMEILSQMGNFVEAYNMDYVSLSDHKLNRYIPNCKFDEVESYSDCFRETDEDRITSQDFIASLQEVEFKDLLTRYFFINNLGSLRRANDRVDEMLENNPSQSLMPLFPKASSGFWSLLERGSRAGASPDGGVTPSTMGGFGASATEGEFEANQYIEEKYEEGTQPVARTVENVKSWLREGRASMKLEDALPLCHSLASNVTKILAEKDMLAKIPFRLRLAFESKEQRALTYLTDICFENVKYLPNQDEVYYGGVSYDRRYKVLQTGPYRHMAGKNMNLNVGIDFGILGYGDSNLVKTLGADGISAVVGIAAAGIGITIGAPVLTVAGLIGLASGAIIMSGTANEINGTMLSTGTSVNAATFLVVQKAEMEITIEKHKKCLSTQFSPELVKSFKLNRLGIKSDIARNDLELHKALTRGLFICDEQVYDTPEKIIENYYYVTQHFTAGDMLDDVNLLNHVWLLALRGKSDFNKFIQTLRTREIDGEGEVVDDSDLNDYSLVRLGEVYSTVLPTFPGMYSVSAPTKVEGAEEEDEE